MKALRTGVLVVAMICGLGVGVASARQIPGVDPSTSDTGSSSYDGYRDPLGGLGGGVQRDAQATDPVVLEPIRPLLPGDPIVEAPMSVVALCGRMDGGVPGLMMACLILIRISGVSGKRTKMPGPVD